MSELTPEQINALAGDQRRAAAAIVHFGRDQYDGVSAVMKEAAEADRVGPFIIAILDLHQELVPELRTDLGLHLLSTHLLRIAGMENKQR